MYNFTEQDFPIIQQYLSNQLKGEQKSVFEQRLEQNPQLREELEWYNAMFNAIEEREDARLKTLLQSSTFENKSEVKGLKIKVWITAACISFLVALGAWLWFTWPLQKQNEELFQAFHLTAEDVYQDLIRTRTASDLKEDSLAVVNFSLQQAQQLDSLYRNGNYQEAFFILERIPTSASTLFYRANCLMGLNKNSEAIPILKEVETYTNENFSNFAQWYLALAYYKTGDINLAKIYAQKTIDNKGILNSEKTRARQLLERLEGENK